MSKSTNFKDNRGHKCWHYLQILLIMTSLPTPFNVEVPRELSSYVGAPQTSTLKGEQREIISYYFLRSQSANIL